MSVDKRLQIDQLEALGETAFRGLVGVVEAIGHHRSRPGLWRVGQTLADNYSYAREKEFKTPIDMSLGIRSRLRWMTPFSALASVCHRSSTVH